jgi:hypothetical protein
LLYATFAMTDSLLNLPGLNGVDAMVFIRYMFEPAPVKGLIGVLIFYWYGVVAGVESSISGATSLPRGKFSKST